MFVNYASSLVKLTFTGVNFLNNTSLSGDGGSLLLNMIYLLSIDKCIFTSNSAILGKGGAVSVKSAKQISFTNSNFTKN